MRSRSDNFIWVLIKQLPTQHQASHHECYCNSLGRQWSQWWRWHDILQWSSTTLISSIFQSTCCFNTAVKPHCQHIHALTFPQDVDRPFLWSSISYNLHKFCCLLTLNKTTIIMFLSHVIKFQAGPALTWPGQWPEIFPVLRYQDNLHLNGSLTKIDTVSDILI